MHKIHFRPGLRPGRGSARTPLGGAYDALQNPQLDGGRLDLKTYRMGVIGPRDNVFPGPAVVLDGPVAHFQKTFKTASLSTFISWPCPLN